MATATKHTYVGAEERVYSAYLAVAPDGTTSTLIGTPGADPVEIRKAGGADYSDPDVEIGKNGKPTEVPRPPLPDVPDDGHWVTDDGKHAGSDEKPAKGTKAGA